MFLSKSCSQSSIFSTFSIFSIVLPHTPPYISFNCIYDLFSFFASSTDTSALFFFLLPTLQISTITITVKNATNTLKIMIVIINTPTLSQTQTLPYKIAHL